MSTPPFSLKNAFSLEGKVVLVTGGGGLLGRRHAEAIAEMGGIPVLADIQLESARKVADLVQSQGAKDSLALEMDVTRADSIKAGLQQILKRFDRIDVLVNNAAIDPKVAANAKAAETMERSRLENLPIETWNLDIAVGLTGSFLCSQIIGTEMAKRNQGNIINMSSDLAIISPDQRLYRKEGVAEDQQPVKSVTYSVVKAGILGLTKYLATYWADRNVRCNAIAPAGIYTDQPEAFLKKISALIPMNRMGTQDELKGALVFLASDASSFVNGATLVVDGGRTIW